MYSKSILKRLAVQTATPGEEEAYLHFILNGFKEVVEKYGVDEVLKLLDEQTASLIWTSCKRDADLSDAQ